MRPQSQPIACQRHGVNAIFQRVPATALMGATDYRFHLIAAVVR
ncbi:hypothetical protein ACX800_22640 [Paenarthrobacter nitroguajacolicus]